MEGFYVAYLTGKAGTSMILFAIKDNYIIGIDTSGVKYDGHVEAKPAHAGFSCRVEYTLSPGTSLITGSGPVATATPVSLTFDLPPNFAEGTVIGIQTPFGPLNAKFKKIRELNA